MPVMVYYASVLRRPLTYKELGTIINRHQRVFYYPFDYIHEWIEELSKELKEDIPPLPLLVFQKGKQSPARTAVDWWLGDRLGKDLKALSEQKKQMLLDGIVEGIIRYPRWSLVLAKLGLKPYKPELDSLTEITTRLKNTYGRGESDEHKAFKRYLTHNLGLLGIKAKNVQCKLEYIFPSLDRVDIWVETESENIAIEVKALEANEDELTRGMYQCLKYEALARGMQREEGKSIRPRAILAIQGKLSDQLRMRQSVLGVSVFENL